MFKRLVFILLMFSLLISCNQGISEGNEVKEIKVIYNLKKASLIFNLADVQNVYNNSLKENSNKSQYERSFLDSVSNDLVLYQDSIYKTKKITKDIIKTNSLGEIYLTDTLVDVPDFSDVRNMRNSIIDDLAFILLKNGKGDVVNYKTGEKEKIIIEDKFDGGGVYSKVFKFPNGEIFWEVVTTYE